MDECKPLVSGGGARNDYLQAVAVDSAGAVVSAGYFSSSPATFRAGAYTRPLFGST